VDFSLSQEQKMLQETVRKFLQKELPRDKIRQLDEKDEPPLEVFNKMKALGLTGLTIAQEYGGAGPDILGAVLVLEEISKVSSSLGMVYLMSSFYGGANISSNGSQEQKRRFLPELARGDLLFSYALTEPNAGSDAASAQTYAARDGHGFKLSGTKTLISGADFADYILILARTDMDLPKHKCLSLFIIDQKAPGLTINPIPKLGFKGSSICEIVLEDVEAGPEDILGGPECLNKGWGQVISTLGGEHLISAALGVGLAQGVFDAALQYAKEREQFGRPIGSFQAIQHKLAEMITGVHTARLLLYHSAWLMQQNIPHALESAMTKYYASETARQVSLEAMRIFGGYGYTMEYDVQRYVRDALLLPLGAGSNEIQKNVMAKQLGL